MSETNPAEQKVEFRFVQDKNYHHVYATGIWGDMGSHGTIDFDLIQDIAQYPEKFIMGIDEKGRLTPDETIIMHGNEKNILWDRVSKVGVSMPLSAVPFFTNWLIEKIIVALDTGAISADHAKSNLKLIDALQEKLNSSK